MPRKAQSGRDEVRLKPALCIVPEQLEGHGVRERQRRVPQRSEQDGAPAETEAQTVALRFVLEIGLYRHHRRGGRVNYVEDPPGVAVFVELKDLVQANNHWRTNSIENTFYRLN